MVSPDTTLPAPEPGGSPLVPPGLRPPRQARSRESLERVLAAGAEILVERGYQGFTITDVARRADASVGLIYKRFEGKAALFEAILVRELERMVREENQRLAEAAAASGSAAEFIAAAVRALAAIAWRDGRLIRVFNERSVVDTALLEHVKAARTAPRLFAELLLQRRGEIRHPDPERAADMAFWLVNSALDRRTATPMWRHWDPGADQDWPLFIDDLVHAVQCFLLTPQAGGPSARRGAC